MNFGSHHPLIHKLGVYERSDDIITDEKDRQEEILHLNKALQTCGYPPCPFRQVRESLNNKLSKEEKSKRKKEKNMDQPQTKSMVTIRYVRGVSEALQRTFRRHGIATAMKPHKTLKQLLVHPKDKCTAQDSVGVVYRCH